MKIFSVSLKGLVVFSCFLAGSRSSAQCISTFPYTEDFETSPAWNSGGANSDWAWGTPVHPLINSAGAGNKSWCVGGLTGSFYEYSAQSWLMSPCFDFSSLNYPWISFKIFWETEWKWDGMVLQYSTDGGASWSNVGAFGDAEDCLNENWYNYHNVSWLTSASNKHGWSGRTGVTSGSCQGGNGSTQWVTAKHCMGVLAGQPNVRFRFLFGSGMTCNDFDGVAIDDILIQEAPPNTAAFTGNCISSNTVSFINLSDNCSTGYTWNFGDPASGASNTSTVENPTHVFSGPGTYTVTLTSAGPCNAPGIFSQDITVLSANVIGTNVICHGQNNGSATVSITGGSGVYTYAWNTVPVQTTPTATDLTAGTYTVTVSGPDACPVTAGVTVTEPDSLAVTTVSSPSCTDVCNGSMGAAASGGIAPYTYTWDLPGSGESFSNVCTGVYNVMVTDAAGCVATSTAAVLAYSSPALTCNAPVICTGSSGVLTASGAAAYTWSPADGLSATTGATVVASPLITTAYVLTGISAQGCSGSIDVLVTVDPATAPVADFSYTPLMPDVFHPEVQFINQSTDDHVLTWYIEGWGAGSDPDPLVIFPSDSGGHYEVCLVVLNTVGCTDSLCREVVVKGETTLYVPNAFTPNGDGINDDFFPVIRDAEAEQFSWTVYNRWGQVIFETDELFSTWDGTQRGVACQEDVYVWKIRYIERTTGVQREKTGQVTLLR